jgi:hypothetical protein
MAVDTKNVQGRRQLHFNSYDEILADVRALSARPTRQLGNWSLGQVCQHLAAGMHMAIDGPPFKPGWLLRTIGPFIKKRMITRPMSPGFRFPQTATVLMPGNPDTAAGVAALEKAVARLREDPERRPHVIFGPMANEEWDQFEFRHCEMHLSLIVPE